MKTTENTAEQFVQLIEQHQKLIWKVAAVYCSESEARKDLSQEIILQLWKSFPKYDPKHKFSTWAYRVALNVAISKYRAKSTRKRTKHNYFKQGEWLVWGTPNWEEEKIERLYQCIGKLKPLDRALIVLYLDGHSGQEVAEIMGFSLSNVSTRIHRIKQLLKDCVKS
ncbi:MAG: sigma-70 family RNA polymerase sigma factor [Saprospiraceae bacterium]